MTFKFLLDECVPRKLARAISFWNASNPSVAIDVVSVGEPADLPFGSDDPEILAWAENNGRVVVTTDYTTMPAHFMDHLAAGHHLVGMLFPRPEATLKQLVESLVVIAVAGAAADLLDTLMYIPI